MKTIVCFQLPCGTKPATCFGLVRLCGNSSLCAPVAAVIKGPLNHKGGGFSESMVESQCFCDDVRGLLGLEGGRIGTCLFLISEKSSDSKPPLAFLLMGDLHGGDLRLEQLPTTHKVKAGKEMKVMDCAQLPIRPLQYYWDKQMNHSQGLDMGSLMSALLFRAVFEVNDTCNRNLLVDTREPAGEQSNGSDVDPKAENGSDGKGGEKKRKEKKVYSIDEMGVFSGFRGGKLFSLQPDASFMNVLRAWIASEAGQRHIARVLDDWQRIFSGPSLLGLLSLYFADGPARLKVLQANLKAIRALLKK